MHISIFITCKISSFCVLRLNIFFFWKILQKVTIFHSMYCHRGGKKSWPNQGLSLTVRALCQLSYRATWSSFDIFPLITPESARSNGGTTRHTLFDARYPSREPLRWPPNVTGGRKKSWPDQDSNPGLLANQASTNWAAEPLGRPLTVHLSTRQRINTSGDMACVAGILTRQSLHSHRYQFLFYIACEIEGTKNGSNKVRRQARYRFMILI